MPQETGERFTIWWAFSSTREPMIFGQFGASVSALRAARLNSSAAILLPVTGR
jgi:hypothetical protein